MGGAHTHDGEPAAGAPDDAVAVVDATDRAAPVVLSCEHASERLPGPWRWPEEDRRLLGSHWTHDLGAAALTRELSAEMGAAAVLARFTRLLIDPNRDLSQASLFLPRAEGWAVRLNEQIDEDDRQRRVAYWRSYHQALDRVVSHSLAPVLFAIHSFTPVYEGRHRQLEIGVLFDEEEQLGGALNATLAEAGFVTRLNEPYSGKGGFIFSAQRHASAHGRAALELEVRQDLAVDAAFRRRLVAALAGFDFAGS